MSDLLAAVRRIDTDVKPFFGLLADLRKSAFQVTPSMPQPGQQADPNGGPPQGPPQGSPPQGPPQDPNAGMPQGGPPQDPNAQPIDPAQMQQVLELLQQVAQKTGEFEKRIGDIEKALAQIASQMQQHGQSLDDHDMRIAQTATAQQGPPAPAQ